MRRRRFEIARSGFHGTFERPTARQRREADLFLADLLGEPLPPSRALESDPFLAELAEDTPGKKAYRTIQEVMSDPAAVRRQAVLASVADFFPAFNTYPANPACEAKLKVGSDSGVLDQGPWMRSYGFNGCGVDTSCTTVNPAVMTAPVCRNNSTKWSFNAGPAVKGGPNPAWVRCDKDHIPSVGDTYIVLNGTAYLRARRHRAARSAERERSVDHGGWRTGRQAAATGAAGPPVGSHGRGSAARRKAAGQLPGDEARQQRGSVSQRRHLWRHPNERAGARPERRRRGHDRSAEISRRAKAV